MRKALIIFMIAISALSCQKDETIEPVKIAYDLTFTVNASADIWWGINELQFIETAGGNFKKSIIIHTGDVFYLRVEAPPVPPSREIQIFIDGELMLEQYLNGQTIRYLIK